MRHPENGDEPLCAALQFLSVASEDFCISGRSFSGVVARSYRYIVGGAVASGGKYGIFYDTFLKIGWIFFGVFCRR